MEFSLGPYNKKKIVYFILLSLLYRAVLDWLYIYSVEPIYNYSGLYVEYVGIGGMILSYIAVAVVGFMIAKTRSAVQPSAFILTFIYLTTYIPISMMYAVGGEAINPFNMLTVCMLFVATIVNMSRIMRMRFDSCISEFSMMIIITIVLLVGLGCVTAKYGFRMPRNIIDVYGVRDEYAQSFGAGFSPMAYFVEWLGNVINPIIIAWGIMRRRIWLLILGTVSQLLIFATAGFKSHLFGFGFLLWVLVGIRYFRKWFVVYMSGSYIFALLVARIIDWKIDSYFLSATLVRRMFVMTAQLYYYYYDFISRETFTFFSQYSFFNWFVRYPYDMNLPHTIADAYFGIPDMAANANMWAEAYASAGFIGMMIVAMLFSFLLKIADGYAFGKNAYLTLSLLAMPVFSLTNTSLFTTMITHGFLLALLIMALLPKQQQYKTIRLDGGIIQAACCREGTSRR